MRMVSGEFQLIIMITNINFSSLTLMLIFNLIQFAPLQAVINTSTKKPSLDIQLITQFQTSEMIMILTTLMILSVGPKLNSTINGTMQDIQRKEIQNQNITEKDIQLIMILQALSNISRALRRSMDNGTSLRMKMFNLELSQIQSAVPLDVINTNTRNQSLDTISTIQFQTLDLIQIWLLHLIMKLSPPRW